MAGFFVPPVPLVIPATNVTWNAMNVSQYVPSTATGVMCLFQSPTTGASAYAAVRGTGSTDNYTGGVALAQGAQATALAPLSSGFSFDFFTETSNEAADGAELFLLGYTEGETGWTSNLNAINLVTSSTSYATISLASTSANGAIAAIVGFSGNPGSFGLRVNGDTTDDFSTNASNSIGMPGWYIVGLDSNSEFQCKTSNTVQVLLLGWITFNFAWNSPAITRTPGTAGTQVALSLEAGAIGYLYQMASTTSGFDWQIVTAQGTTLPYTIGGKGSAQVSMAGSAPYAKISSTSLAVKELGYWLASPPSTVYTPFQQTTMIVRDSLIVS